MPYSSPQENLSRAIAQRCRGQSQQTTDDLRAVVTLFGIGETEVPSDSERRRCENLLVRAGISDVTEPREFFASLRTYIARNPSLAKLLAGLPTCLGSARDRSVASSTARLGLSTTKIPNQASAPCAGQSRGGLLAAIAFRQ